MLQGVIHQTLSNCRLLWNLKTNIQIPEKFQIWIFEIGIQMVQFFEDFF